MSYSEEEANLVRDSLRTTKMEELFEGVNEYVTEEVIALHDKGKGDCLISIIGLARFLMNLHAGKEELKRLKETIRVVREGK